MQVAALYRGRPDFDVAALVAELVEAESVPFLPVLRYKPSGLRKREVWERTWDLQRQEDAGEDVGDIPVPPKYASADFLKTDYWRLRGKLDVPKERWISYPHCQTESDPSLVVGWAGWDHLQQATALVAYYDARKREGWDAKRLTPLLAGLDQLLPWIHQWHPEIDPEFGETAGQSYQTLLETRRPRTRPDPGRHPQLAAAPGDDPATGEDVTMDKLISELLILPERVRKGDFVLNLSKGVTEPEKTLDEYVVTPQLAGCFDDALGFIRSAVDADEQQGVLPARQLRCRQVALHGGAAPAAAAQPRRAGQGRPRRRSAPSTAGSRTRSSCSCRTT